VIEEKEVSASLLTTVFDDPSDESTPLDCGPEHFWDGFLFEYPLLLSFNWQADINCAALSREYLHSETVLRQKDLTRVCVIQLDGRSRTGYLDRERGRGGDGDGGHHRVDKHRSLRAIHCGIFVGRGNDRGGDSQTKGYSVNLALYHHGGILAAVQADDVADLAIFYRKTWLILLVLL